jgi:cell division protein FtsX
MSKWFVEPSITAERVPWKYSYYFYYPFALDVDDSQLIRAGEVMRTNIKINEISTVAVFILSAAAGFLMGFLMINRRKREIMLMRTVGVPDARIFLEFFAEQLVLCTIGAAIGGVAFSWQPIERIAVFIGLYSAGLAISLIVFLRKNLLTSIKEE